MFSQVTNRWCHIQNNCHTFNLWFGMSWARHEAIHKHDSTHLKCLHNSAVDKRQARGYDRLSARTTLCWKCALLIIFVDINLFPEKCAFLKNFTAAISGQPIFDRHHTYISEVHVVENLLDRFVDCVHIVVRFQIEEKCCFWLCNTPYKVYLENLIFNSEKKVLSAHITNIDKVLFYTVLARMNCSIRLQLIPRGFLCCLSQCRRIFAGYPRAYFLPPEFSLTCVGTW